MAPGPSARRESLSAKTAFFKSPAVGIQAASVGYLTGGEHRRFWNRCWLQLHRHQRQVVAEVYAGAEIVDRAHHRVEHLSRGCETTVEAALEFLGAEAIAGWGDRVGHAIRVEQQAGGGAQGQALRRVLGRLIEAEHQCW